MVQSEFEINHRVFIPYNWVDIPWHPFHTKDVAKGDSRDYDPDVKNISTYRVEQIAVINAYRDLSASWLIEQKNTPGITEHYHEDDVINFNEGAKHSEDVDVKPSTIKEGATPDDSGYANIDSVKATEQPDISNDTQSFIKIEGSASEPIIAGAEPIDWDYNIGVEIDDPLNPTVAFSGLHDGFPAYEVYLNPNHPLFPVTTVWQFKPDLDKSVLILFGGATFPTGGFRVNIEQ